MRATNANRPLALQTQDSGSRVTSGIIDSHFDEIQTKLLHASFTSGLVCRAYVQLPRVAEHSSVMSMVLVSSYIKKRGAWLAFRRTTRSGTAKAGQCSRIGATDAVRSGNPRTDALT
jgi:hypothetical protein